MSVQTELFLFKKRPDWSFFNAGGFAIKQTFQPLVYACFGRRIEVGESVKIKIELDGQLYDATLHNNPFNRDIYPDHKEQLRVLYGKNSPLAQKLKDVFSDLWQQVKKEHDSPETERLSQNSNDYFALCGTANPNVFAMETFLAKDFTAEKFPNITEEQYEMSINTLTDDTSGVVFTQSIRKVRKLDRSIGDSLKKLYDYRCQITGERIGEQYGEYVIEAHHIDYFTKSQNNDASNIVILSPNMHRIIHKTNPQFERKTLSFNFPNGIIETIKIDKHLSL